MTVLEGRLPETTEECFVDRALMDAMGLSVGDQLVLESGTDDKLEDTLNTAMNNIRESVHDLHDEAVNLRETAENLVADFHSCPVSLEYDISCPPPPEVRYCMIAVLKEGLSNIAAHSQAEQAWITLREHPGMYQLIIRDNGVGTGGAVPETHGIGLSNMKERVEALNGSIHIQAENGFRIFITIPKK